MGMRAWLTRGPAMVTAVAWSADARVRGWLARGGTSVAAGTRLRAWLVTGAIALAVAAAVAGLALTVAGVNSAWRTALVLLFLAAGPTAAVAGLLRGFPPAARVIIAFTTDLMIIALIAIVMLSAGLWSPTGGLAAVAVVTAACFAAQLPAARQVFLAWRAAIWPAVARLRPEMGRADRAEPASAEEQAPAEEAAAEPVTAEPGHRNP